MAAGGAILESDKTLGTSFSEDAIILVSTKNNKDGGQSIAQSMLFGWLLPSFKTRFIIVSASDDKYISEA